MKIRAWAIIAIFTMVAVGAWAQKPGRKLHVHPLPTSGPAPPPSYVPPTAPTQGMWTTLAYGSPINPVHVALMRNGKLLVVSGSGNYPGNHVLVAGVWDPSAQLMATFPIASDMFCNGMVVLPDGRPLVIGGTASYTGSSIGLFTGLATTAIFDPAAGTFAAGGRMANGRWYPTATVLPNGTVMAISGLDSAGNMNMTVEIYDPATNHWSPAGEAFSSVDYYPRQHVLPNGKVFESGWNPDTQMWDPATHVWTPVATTQLGQTRLYGTSVLLPLTPANGFKAKVIIMGGSATEDEPATATTETIDLSAPAPQWVYGPTMVAPRIEMNATLLPDGKVLVSGGSVLDEDPSTATLPAELYDPATNTLAPAGKMAYPRLYHSNTILLPDATVVALGGNPIRGDYEGNIEIYSPPYLFQPNGAPSPRPDISRHPETISYGATFSLSVTVPAGGSVGSLALMRPGAVTHSFDMEQRLVGLSFTSAGGKLTVTAPSKPSLAPPGWYLLFALDAKGVPSVGKFVRLGR